MQATTRDIVVDGTTLKVRTIGDGPDVVLLIHGWMTSGAVWDDVLPLLDATGRTLVIPHLRGTGGSDVHPGGGDHYTLAKMGADLIGIVDSFGEKAKRYTAIGHSMGGQLAMWLAATQGERVRATAALTPVPLSGIPLPDDARGLFSTSGGDRGKQGTILGLACKEITDEARDRLLDDAGTIPAHVIAEVFASWSAGFGADVDLGAAVGSVMVLGTDDAFTPPPFMQEAIVQKARRGRFVHLPGPGHYPQLERPAATAAVLNAFLASL